MTSEDGGITTEVVLLAPVLLLLLGFVVVAGRIAETSGAVVHAAHQAARAASLVASPEAARDAAEGTARSNLTELGVGCRDLDVGVDTARFGPGGEVAVSVACTADLSDVAFGGLPGIRHFEARATEVIDRFRGGAP